MKKILWRTGLAFLSFLILALIFLLSTSGLKLGLLIGTSFLPGELHYKTASGLITGPIKLTDLDYRQGTQEIRVKSLQFNWNLWALMIKKLSISQISADRIEIIEHKSTSQKSPPLDLSLFYKKNPFEHYTEQANAMARNYTQFLKNFKWSWDIQIKNAYLGPIRYYAPTHTLILELSSLHVSGELSKQKSNFSIDTTTRFPYTTQIQASLSGNSTHYLLNFSAAGKEMNFRISGSGNEHHLNLSTTKTTVLNGLLNGHLNLDWKNDLIWETHLIANHINFSSFYPKWSQNFQADIQSKGNLSRKNPGFNLSAKIKTPLSHIDLDIQHQNDWQAKWDIALANRKYQIQGTLRGPFGNPSTTGTLKIRDFSYSPYSASSLTAQWKINLIENTPATISVTADQFSSGTFFAKKLRASLTGTLSQHQIALSADFQNSGTQISMNGSLKGKTWSAKLLRWNWGDFHLPSQDQVDMQITLPDYKSGLPQKNNKIDATLHVNLSHLAFISELIRDLNVQAGKIAGSLHITGTLASPLISGELDFSEGALFIPAWDLKLTHASITSLAVGHVVKYTAEAISGKNPVTITGETDFSQAGIPTHLKLKGNDILLVDTPEYTIYGSPNVSATIVGTRLDLSGDILLPRALIRPHDFRNTTQLPTNEVVFIGQPKVVGQSSWQINSNLNIIAGEQVLIDSFGIQGSLDGAVHIIQTPDQTLLANGKIGIRHGFYRAYGHQLKISHGSFMQFTNSPINNPMLSIEATRTVTASAGSQIQAFASEKIIVGMNVHGPLNNPDINLFSSLGNLSQSEILSYILTGGAAANNSAFGAPNTNASGNFAYNANILDAIKLGASGVGGTESLLQRIQSGLGFSELGIESNTTLDAVGNPLGSQTNFVIGRHITKDLYLRYTRGIYGPGLAQENLITLRYLIRKNWAIQLESSEFSNTAVWGADILYTTERN